ncbi:MAG: hypothetical protein ACKERG_01065 [Candidatus Hodgkinia cicadicola]
MYKHKLCTSRSCVVLRPGFSTLQNQHATGVSCGFDAYVRRAHFPNLRWLMVETYGILRGNPKALPRKHLHIAMGLMRADTIVSYLWLAEFHKVRSFRGHLPFFKHLLSF